MTDYKASKRIVGTSAERDPNTIGSGWTVSGDSFISESGGVISFSASSGGDCLLINSLPATAGTSWVVRYKLDITQSNYGGSGSGNHLVGISDSFSRSGSGEDPPNSSTSMYVKNTYHSDKKFAQYWTNGSTNGNDWDNGGTLSSGAQTWYVTITNNSGSMTTRYGASSDYTGGSITSAWTVNATTQSTSKTKIFITAFCSANISSGGFAGTISDLKFYNNTTTPTSDNYQTNTIWSETDTGKDYIWSGSAWTEVA